MTATGTPARLKKGDWTVLALLTLLSAGSGLVLFHTFGSATREQLTVALTNIATVGSVVSGLSLAGLSALSLSSGALDALRDRWGSHVRGVLLGTYGLAACLALASGVLAAFPHALAARLVAGFGPPLLVALLFAATFVVTSLYRLGNHPKLPAEEPVGPAPTYTQD